jgi:transposase InsO family protein
MVPASCGKPPAVLATTSDVIRSPGTCGPPVSPELAAQTGQCHKTRSRRRAASRSGGRDFTARTPNQLWVTDLTFVSTWAGVAYVCFITDAFSRMIVGWRVVGHMRTPMVLDAIEMARWSRGKTLAVLRRLIEPG